MEDIQLDNGQIIENIIEVREYTDYFNNEHIVVTTEEGLTYYLDKE